MRQECYFCTYKHLDTARTANIEMMLGHPENNKGIVGELVHAAQEVFNYDPELSLAIRDIWKTFEESLWSCDIVQEIEAVMDTVEEMAKDEAAAAMISLDDLETTKPEQTQLEKNVQKPKESKDKTGDSTEDWVGIPKPPKDDLLP